MFLLKHNLRQEDKTDDYENCEETLQDCSMCEDDDLKEIVRTL